MRLIGVIRIHDNTDLTKELPIQNILNKDYTSVFEVYINFRNIVKKGRYVLGMTKSKNMGKDGHHMTLYDTQLLEKNFNNMKTERGVLQEGEELMVVMVAAQLDDGREHIHNKNNKPLKYDLNDKKDKHIIAKYVDRFITKKLMCYTKDLKFMLPSNKVSKKNKVMVKSIEYYHYDDTLHIPYRTLGVLDESDIERILYYEK